jgi:hypothetical protein
MPETRHLGSRHPVCPTKPTTSPSCCHNAHTPMQAIPVPHDLPRPTSPHQRFTYSPNPLNLALQCHLEPPTISTCDVLNTSLPTSAALGGGAEKNTGTFPARSGHSYAINLFPGTSQSPNVHSHSSTCQACGSTWLRGELPLPFPPTSPHFTQCGFDSGFEPPHSLYRQLDSTAVPSSFQHQSLSFHTEPGNMPRMLGTANRGSVASPSNTNVSYPTSHSLS